MICKHTQGYAAVELVSNGSYPLPSGIIAIAEINEALSSGDHQQTLAALLLPTAKLTGVNPPTAKHYHDVLQHTKQLLCQVLSLTWVGLSTAYERHTEIAQGDNMTTFIVQYNSDVATCQGWLSFLLGLDSRFTNLKWPQCCILIKLNAKSVKNVYEYLMYITKSGKCLQKKHIYYT